MLKDVLIVIRHFNEHSSNEILKNNKLPEINKDYTWGKSLMTKKKFREMITFKKEECLISDSEED